MDVHVPEPEPAPSGDVIVTVVSPPADSSPTDSELQQLRAEMLAKFEEIKEMVAAGAAVTVAAVAASEPEPQPEAEPEPAVIEAAPEPSPTTEREDQAEEQPAEVGRAARPRHPWI
jgi:hypothetical protein